MNPDWLAAIGILGTIASVIGLLYAWLVSSRSNRKKILTYDISFPLALASVLPDRIEHRLSIVYERRGQAPINVKGAYLWMVVLGNIGREPIKREDIAPSDHLKIEVRGAKVLDIAKVSVSRDVINFDVTLYGESADNITSSLLSFDFLDYKDTATIRLLTDDRNASIQIKGTIIGMPEGIKRQGELNILNKYPFIKNNTIEMFVLSVWASWFVLVIFFLFIIHQYFLDIGESSFLLALLFSTFFPLILIFSIVIFIRRRVRLPIPAPFKY